jgi:hypothetical protein
LGAEIEFVYPAGPEGSFLSILRLMMKADPLSEMLYVFYFKH